MLLDSLEFSEELAGAVGACSDSIIIASAFIKAPALKAVLKDVNPSIDVSVIARWQPQDLISNASDLSTYEFCTEYGYQFGISQNFHGKLYVLDKSSVLLGSANLTARGLALQNNSNIEFGAKIQLRVEDIGKIDTFLNKEVIWLSQALYSSICNDISSLKSRYSSQSGTLRWSDSVARALEKPVSYLWVNELLFKMPNELLHMDFDDPSAVHDFQLLDLEVDDLSTRALKKAFRRSRLYLWICNQLEVHPKAKFGKLSHLLQNALLDDPKPYRKDVKDFVAIMYAWFEFMDDDFELFSYSHTTTVELKN